MDVRVGNRGGGGGRSTHVVATTATVVVEPGLTLPAAVSSVVEAGLSDFEAWYLREHPKVVAALT